MYQLASCTRSTAGSCLLTPLGMVAMWPLQTTVANSLPLHGLRVQCCRLDSFQPPLAEAAEQCQSRVSITESSRAQRNIAEKLLHLVAKQRLVNRIPIDAAIRE